MRTKRPARQGGPIAATLFGLTRQGVLSLFFGRPSERFYVREVARRTDIALGALQRELTALVAAGILTRQQEGRQVYYQANGKSPVFPELRSLVAKTSGLADVVQGALAALAPRIEAALIFGSMAGDGGGPDSDVDLFVVGDVSLSALVDALGDAERDLGREINPVVQSRAEFRRRTAAADHFVTTLLAGPRLFLIGDDDGLARLGAQRVDRSASDEPPGNRRAAPARGSRPARQSRARSQS